MQDTSQEAISIVMVNDTESLDKVALVEMEQSETFQNIQVLNLTGFDDRFHMVVGERRVKNDCQILGWCNWMDMISVLEIGVMK